MLHKRTEVWPNDAIPKGSTGQARPRLALDRPYLTVHYTGGGLWLDKDDTPSELRKIQYAAIAAKKPWEYNYVIDGQGEVWEYAGKYQAAHSEGENLLAYGVLLLLGLSDPTHLTGFEKPTAEMIESFRWLRNMLLEDHSLSAQHVVRQHRQMPGAVTLCPGPSVIERWNDFIQPWQAPVPEILLPPPPVGTTTGDDNMAYVILDIDSDPGPVDPNPEMFGGIGAPIIDPQGNATGGYLVPVVSWLSPTSYANKAPYSKVLKFTKTDLKQCVLVGPMPQGYTAADFEAVG